MENPYDSVPKPRRAAMAGPSNLSDYLDDIGVRALPALTSPFDPGVAPVELESHLAQSSHLMLSLKISMACWMIAEESATRRKLAYAHAADVVVTAGGGPYEVAVEQGRLDEYLDLCADVGFDAIECGSGFTAGADSPQEVADKAKARGLGFDFELGKKHAGQLTAEELPALIEEGHRWLEAGAGRLIVEARESAAAVGLFDHRGRMNELLAERLIDAFGLSKLLFEAPNKASQFALLDRFGPYVQLANVPLAELLRVEIYRRGLHSDAFDHPELRPARVPTKAVAR